MTSELAAGQQKPPSHKTFQLGNVTLSSDFDSGNLSYAEKANSVSYNVWIGTDHPENNYRTWFYFWVEGVSRGSTITFNVKNMHNQTRLLNEGLVPVFRNEQQPTWRRIAHKINTSSMTFNEDGFLQFSFRHTFESDTRTYLAFFYPWSTKDNDLLLQSLQLTAKQSADIYFHRTTLVYSYENRPVQLVTISSTGKITKQEEHIEDKILFPQKHRPKSFANDKKAIFLSARVHPGEVPSSHVMNGVLKGLLKDTDVARLLREKFVFYIVPIINPDGVYRGHYRTDRNGVNLNRYYINPNPKDHPPIYAIKKFILHLHNTKRFFACMDMHAHAGRKGAFIYGNYSTELKKQLDICIYPKILSLNSKNFDYEASNFTEKNMYCKDRADSISKEGAARVALFKITKNPYCWTLQCNYNMGRYENQICERNQQNIPPVKEEKFDRDLIANYQNLNPVQAKSFYTIQTYQNLGEEILESFLDLIQIHPRSRINNPNSRFRNLTNLKLNLLIALMKMVPYHFESNYRKILLSVSSDKEQINLRAIRALYQIFIRNRPIQNIDQFLKNEPPPLNAIKPPIKSTLSKLPSIREHSSSLYRRRTQQLFQQPQPQPQQQQQQQQQQPDMAPSDQDQHLDSQQAGLVISTNETVEQAITNFNNLKGKRQSSLIRSLEKQEFEVKTKLREYIERLSVNQAVDEAASLQNMPTLKVVNLKIMKKVSRNQQTIELGSGRQPARSLLFRRTQDRELSSGIRRGSKQISESLGAS